MKQLFRSLRAAVVVGALCLGPLPLLSNAQSVTLQQAVATGRVIASFEGVGASSGDSIKVKVRKGPKAGPGPIDVTVPPGSILAGAPGGGYQNMVVAGVSGQETGNGMMRPTSTITVNSTSFVTYILSAFCAEFEKDNPSGSSTFTIRAPDPVLACIARRSESLSVSATQAAVWMHTDNITYEHMKKKFEVTAAEWTAGQKVYRDCRPR